MHAWWGIPSWYHDEGLLSVTTECLPNILWARVVSVQPAMIYQYWLCDALLLVRWWPHAGWMRQDFLFAAGCWILVHGMMMFTREEARMH
jgi:hypothetical protein